MYTRYSRPMQVSPDSRTSRDPSDNGRQSGAEVLEPAGVGVTFFRRVGSYLVDRRTAPERDERKRRAPLAYSACLGHAQLVHATPQVLPQSQSAPRAYLNDVIAALTSGHRD